MVEKGEPAGSPFSRFALLIHHRMTPIILRGVRSKIRNPKSEIRNKIKIKNTNV
jgi:hypothetical protein